MPAPPQSAARACAPFPPPGPPRPAGSGPGAQWSPGPIRAFAILLGGDARADVDGVADLDGPFELPLERPELLGPRRGHHPPEQALLDGERSEEHTSEL